MEALKRQRRKLLARKTDLTGVKFENISFPMTLTLKQNIKIKRPTILENKLVDVISGIPEIQY